MSVYIGIDNGLRGGIVALSDHPGPPIGAWVMPLQSKSKGNEVDGYAFQEILYSFDPEKLTVILETPGKHSPGVLALCSMWDSYGVIRGVLEARGIKHHRIDPKTWQRFMLPDCAKGDTKPAALAKANAIWPSETWLESKRCKKPHDGLVDAALIGEYGRIKNL